jgi:hypothetical protein
MGSLAAGGAAAMGTGAFQIMSSDRTSNIRVTADDTSLIVLKDDTPGNIVHQSANGELSIDFSKVSDGKGLNVDSMYQFGRIAYQPLSGAYLEDTKLEKAAYDDEDGNGWKGPYDDPAFYIVNQSSGKKNVEVTIAPEDPPLEIYFQLQDKDLRESGGETAIMASPKPDGDYENVDRKETLTLDSGEKMGVSFYIATGDSVDNDMTGNLDITAKRPE